MNFELMKMSVDSLQQKDSDKVAEPLVLKMQLLKPTLTKKLEPYVVIKVYLSSIVSVFVGKFLLHILFMYLYHKIQFFFKLSAKRNS